ncbi:hypothetical protein [Vibrio ulleungensis]|uniref:Uncharacterized protein n=1 Tax=Vibrio ulleungensis TaxID=2807619 RepID=A0ABS2HM61_9VIBR|nr:hypothetical protein [Vibrio ulleungensis]MBM7038568.1 hypothetical protein [Vibrio ulleungensis]
MSKPTPMGDTFDSYLKKARHSSPTSKSVKASAPKSQQGSVSLPVYDQSKLPSKSDSGNEVAAAVSEQKLFSAKTQLLLEQFSGVEQKKILKFWYEMTISFGSKFRYEFGDEPDRHVMKFAAALNEQSYQRLKDNLDERLKKGQEWPPTVAALEALKDTPTDREILEARTNILTLKNPKSRVEKYIIDRKSAKLRTLSDMHIAKEFKTLYLEAFEEVLLHDFDTILDHQEQNNHSVVAKIEPTDLDRKIDSLAEQGYRPSGSLGERLERIEQLRKAQSK